MIKYSSNGLRISINGQRETSNSIFILVHGMGGSLHNFAGLMLLSNPSICVISIELPGHGKSADLVPHWSLDSISAEVWSAIEYEVGESSFYLIGHSLGAFIGARISSFAGAQMLGLVAISGALFYVGDLLKKPFTSIFRDPKRMFSLGLALVTATAKPSDKFCERLNTSPVARLTLWPFLSPKLLSRGCQVGNSFREQGGIGAFRLLRLAKHVDLRPLYESCESPLFFITGEKDPLTTQKDREYVMSQFGNPALQTVPGAAHWPQVESTQLTYEKILDWTNA